MSSIAFAAAVHSLARRILRSRAAAFDLACLDWEDLSPSDRDWYLQKAAELLNNMSPDGYRHDLEIEHTPAPVLVFRRES